MEELVRLRPAKRDLKFTSEKEWERSECKKSPTGSHHFRPYYGVLTCRFCKKTHEEVYPETYKEKRYFNVGLD